MNKIVSFGLAKLLKEKGFDEVTTLIYMTNHTSEALFENINGLRHSDGNNPFCSAPTIGDVVMWLYEKCGIWVNVEMSFGYSFNGFMYQIETKKEGILHTKHEFKTPIEAYETSIDYVLNNLI